MFTYKASKVNLDGTLTTIDHLGHHELDEWMLWAYGKFATVSVARCDGKTAVWTDDGQEWDKVICVQA